MANVSVYNMEGKQVDTIELSDAVFGVEVNEHLVHLAVKQQLAANRQGTQKAARRYLAAEESRTDRRAQVMQDRVQRELRSSRAAVLCLPRFRVIIPSP